MASGPFRIRITVFLWLWAIGFAAGNSTLLETTDTGATWSTVKENLILYEMDFPTPEKGFGVGADGLIIRTTNGGTQVSTGPRRRAQSDVFTVFPNPAANLVKIRSNHKNEVKKIVIPKK